MIIHSKFKNYHIHMESDFNFLYDLFQMSNTVFVIDEKFYNLYYKILKEIPNFRLILIEAIEENKKIETALAICEKMTELPFKRNLHLVSLGGGIVQDITGFVSSILYRGIPWTFIPTTLLASADSCIGGKTSLNYKKYKNLLGTFYPPDDIYICSKFFLSLSEGDFESGLGEVIKFNIMSGEHGLENVENNLNSLLTREDTCLQKFVCSSLEFKKSFIEIDEFDHGERVKLNFAHTFGHAIETVTQYKIPHGTAVAIGMIMANYIAKERGLLNSDIVRRSENILLHIIHIKDNLRNYTIEQFVNAMHKDKKQIGSQLTIVLLTNKPKELKIVHDVQTKEIEEAFNYFEQLYYNT